MTPAKRSKIYDVIMMDLFHVFLVNPPWTVLFVRPYSAKPAGPLR